MTIQMPKPIPRSVAEHEHRLRHAGMVCVLCDHVLGLDIQVLVGQGLAHRNCGPSLHHAALLAEVMSAAPGEDT